jgi:hypothetical protein
MAEDCITVTFEDGSTWDCCWSDGVAEGGWKAEDVTLGLRRSHTPAGRSWRTCQYFLKGMSAICFNWDGESCTVEGSNPSGYNNGHCDFLGRRSWCDKYSPSVTDDLEEYVCVAPNPYLTGVGDRVDEILYAVSKSEIGGYNEQEGVGICDCYGMGRGEAGCNAVGELIDADFSTIEKTISKLPIVCQYYRPYQMGFGAKDPALDDLDLGRRMPLNYEIYNYMSRFQKCQWWDKDYGSKFEMSAGTLVLEDDECFDTSGKVLYCTCGDGLASDYNTRINTDEMLQSGFLLGNVWARAGGHICNGARPECPCYSGKWHYLVEEKMLPGMPVTANQIFELRFWCNDWKSQDEYDNYFLQKPNLDDPETASIFTFTKWGKFAVDPSDSTMIGKKLSMCQPAPLNAKEFFPEKYIEVESPINYAPIGVEEGTRSPSDRAFASLIRWPNYPDPRPFIIVYPYYSDASVFNDDMICVEPTHDGHTKYHHTMDNDSIYSIGFTVRNKKVYCVNLSYAGVGFLDFSLHDKSVNLLPQIIRDSVFKDVTNIINSAMMNSPEWITNTVSDSQQGYFILPPIQLQYGINILFMCVDFNDGTWGFSHVTVYNEWCGGVLQQISYTHAYEDNAFNTQPFEINPPASARVTAKILGGSKSVVLDSVYKETTLLGRDKYSYSVVERSTSVTVEKWGHIGDSSVVLAEIDDVNLNYIFKWSIVSAVMNPTTYVDSEGNTQLNRKHAFPIEMEEIEVDRNNLSPNICILKTINIEESRVTFMNSEWSLDIEYMWEEFDPTASVVGRAVAGAGQIQGDYKAAPVSVSVEDDIMTVEDLKKGPIGVIGFFKNIDGRVVSVMATKVYVCIADVRCRNVEILYAYKGVGPETVLSPPGSAYDVQGSEPTGASNTYGYGPPCGDHEFGFFIGGPMWFPFNACRQYDLYNVFTYCNHCQAGIVGPMNDAVVEIMDYSSWYGVGDVVRRLDYRYCAVAESYVRGEIFAAGACMTPCKYFTTKVSDYEFTGYCNIVSRVNLNAWLGVHPPFGNDGCELTEKYLSRDYMTHMDKQGFIRSEWMPIVMDNNSFYFSFNAFDGGNDVEELSYSDPLANDPFRYVDQLNFFTLSDIDERIIYEDRRRFDEVFKIHHEGNCSYPPPVLELTGVSFYDFKNKETAWAWPERWKDVERIVFLDKLDFIFKYEKPRYIFSTYKEEHRLICSEGEHIISYTSPVVEEGVFIKYPTLTLDNGVPRPFEIIYNDYNKNQITWKNHEEVGGSGGSDGGPDDGSIYEKTVGENWIHEEGHDMVFDGEASEIEHNDRCITIGISFGAEMKRYYNRGIEINIPRNRLVYLPKEEEEVLVSIYDGSLDVIGERLAVDVPSLPSSILWDDAFVSITTKEGYYSLTGFTITGLIISGVWGYLNVGVGEEIKNRCFVKPGIILQGIKEGGERVELLNLPSEFPYFSDTLELYEIKSEFLVTPNDMINERLIGYSLLLNGSYGNIIAVDDLILRIATEYKTNTSSEQINVWERKYVSSTFTVGNEMFNLDGPGDHLSYHLDLHDSGVYYPFSETYPSVSTEGSQFVGGGGEFGGGGASGGWVSDVDSVDNPDGLVATIKAADKMRSAYGNYRQVGTEKIGINISNLHDIEAEKQKALYEAAYNMSPSDVLSFVCVTPPQIGDTVRPMYERGGGCVFRFARVAWDNHILVSQFKQWDFWQPGGHFYAWSTTTTLTKCFFFGGNFMIHHAVLHHPGHTGEHCPASSTYFDAYYTVRPSALLAKYSRFIILSGQPPDGGWDLVAQANPYYNGPRQH